MGSWPGGHRGFGFWVACIVPNIVSHEEPMCIELCRESIDCSSYGGSPILGVPFLGSPY